MALSLPTPVRVAAGLVGSTLDLLRNLPQELPALGVELAGQAFRIGLRVRQEVAALAVRGDDLLGGLGRKSEDKPSWATFDEDTPPVPGAAQAASPPPAAPDRGSPVSGRPAPPRRTTTGPVTPPQRRPRAARVTAAPDPGSGASPTVGPGSGRPTGPDVATSGAAAAAKSKARSATRAHDPTVVHPPVEVSAEVSNPSPGHETSPTGSGDPLQKSTVDLRDVLGGLDEAAVAALLVREESGQARAAYLTLLGNRLTTLRAGAGS